MKNEQRQQARNLYFQSGFTKTQIADLLSVSRRTITQWSIDGNWENLKRSAQNMPAILAEKVYYLIGHFTDHLLTKESAYSSLTKADADILYRLTTTVNKLKKGSTVNENMETFTYFLEKMKRKDPALADQVIPYVTEYIESRKDTNECSFLLDGFNENGFIDFPEEELMEKLRDEEDMQAIIAEALAKKEELEAKEKQIPLEEKTNPAATDRAASAPTPLVQKPEPAQKPQQQINEKTAAAKKLPHFLNKGQRGNSLPEYMKRTDAINNSNIQAA